MLLFVGVLAKGTTKAVVGGGKKKKEENQLGSSELRAESLAAWTFLILLYTELSPFHGVWNLHAKVQYTIYYIL